MRFSQQQRSPWQPVGLSRQILNYQADNIGAHALTERASFTVPTGVRAWIQVISLSMNWSAAPVPGKVRAYARINTTPILSAAMSDDDGRRFANAAVGEAGVVDAGEAFSLATVDSGLDGNTDWNLHALLRRY